MTKAKIDGGLIDRIHINVYSVEAETDVADLLASGDLQRVNITPEPEAGYVAVSLTTQGTRLVAK